MRKPQVPLFTLVLVVLFAGAFWMRAGRGHAPIDQSPAPGCDSASAAKVVIDSLSNVDPFRSQILRFAREAHRVRIVTMPDSSSRITDGMAIIYVDDRCHITSLVQTDSA